MNKCTFCGREADQEVQYIGGYTILESCTDCEEEIMNDSKL